MTTHRPNSAFTLVEALVAIVVIAVVAATVMPVISSATDAYTSATRTRQAASDTAFALDRCVALVRDIPPDPDNPAKLAVHTATATQLRLADGRGVRLDGATLLLRSAEGVEAPLLRGVEAFELTYLAQDGVAHAASPADTWRINIAVKASGFDLRTGAFIRVRAVGS